jgi:hypothetical protein
VLRGADALLGAAVLVLAELAVVFIVARAELAGPWEIRDGLFALAPLAWVTAGPVALIGREVGDEVKVRMPAGERLYEILEVEYR